MLFSVFVSHNHCKRAVGHSHTSKLSMLPCLLWIPCLQVYSPGLLALLAVPDFSMPYNVICLSSTVLAVFMGGTLNALLWPPGKDAAADLKAAMLSRRAKVVRLVFVIVVFAGVALHFDKELQADLLNRALG